MRLICEFQNVEGPGNINDLDIVDKRHKNNLMLIFGTVLILLRQQLLLGQLPVR